MSGNIRFQVSKTDDLENVDLTKGDQTGNGHDTSSGLRGFNTASYGSLPATSVDGIHPSISVTDPDGTRRGENERMCAYFNFFTKIENIV